MLDCIKMKVSEIKEGYLVDLEDDPYGDPHSSPVFQSEFQSVCLVRKEAPDCIVIGFEGYDHVGFPIDHELSVVRSSVNSTQQY